MTGTAKTQEKEIREVYGMEVVQIPTNRPRQRVDQPDIIFSTQEAKYKYVAAETKKRHEKVNQFSLVQHQSYSPKRLLII